MRQKVLFAVVFTIFIDMLGYGILIPVIPQLLANPHSPFFLLPAGFSLQQGYILLGFLMAIFPFMQFLATPILGELSDRYGRKSVLALSLFGTCISYIIFAVGIIGRSIPLLFFARALDGITGGNISVAQAAIADISTPEDRAKNFGLVGAAFGLGFILGPYIGGKLSDPSLVSWFDATVPFWFAALLSFINVLFVIFLLPETLKKKTSILSLHLGKSFSNIRRALRMEHIRPLLATNFLFQGGFAFFTSFFGVFLIMRFGFDQGSIGNYFAYVGLWVVFAQAVVTRRMSGKFSEGAIVKVSLVCAGLCILAMLLPSRWEWLLLITPLFAIANGLSQSNLNGLVSRSVGPEMQGEILGINASVQALAQTIPPVLSGFVAAELSAYAPVFVSGLTIVLAGLVFVLFAQKTHHTRRA